MSSSNPMGPRPHFGNGTKVDFFGGAGHGLILHHDFLGVVKNEDEGENSNMTEIVEDVNKLGPAGSRKAREYLLAPDKRLQRFLIGMSLVAVAAVIISHYVR